MSSRTRELVLIVALVAIGAILRALSWHAGLWRDEGSTYFDINGSFPAGVVQTVGKSELSPPGFFLLLAAWAHLFGYSELALKLPSFIFALALIPATYALGRVATPGLNTARLAALIAATAPAATFYAQDARGYSLAALLCCLAATALLRLVESGRIAPAAAFAALSVAFIYVQYTGIIFVGTTLLAAAYAGIVFRSRGWIRPYALALAAIVVLVLPLAPSVAFALHVGNPWSAPNSGVGTRIRNALANLVTAVPLPVPAWRTQLQATVGAFLLLLVGASMPASNRGELRAALGRPPALLALMFGVAALIESVQGVSVMFAFVPMGWVCLAFWVAWLYERGRERWPHTAVLGYVAALGLVAYVVVEEAAAVQFGYAADASGIRPYLTGGPPTDRAYLIAPDFMAPTFGYYARGTPTVQFHGFAQWDHPEYIDLAGIEKQWNSPTLLTDTLARIGRLKVGWLDLVLTPEPWGRADTAHLHLSRTDELLDALKRRYSVVDVQSFAGREEPIIVYRFALQH